MKEKWRVVTIALLPIGFGLLVLALRLRLVRRTLRRGQAPSEDVLEEFLKEGLILFLSGIVTLLLSIIWEKTIVNFAGYSILIGAGSSVSYLGIPSLLQWIVGKRKGTERQIGTWENILKYGGTACIIAYVAYQLVVSLK